MKPTSILSAIVLLASSSGRVAATPASTDIYYHEQTQTLGSGVWTFGSEGVTIFSPDGSTVLKSMSAADLGCPQGGCSYFAVNTDGHKYVWASALHGSPNRLDVFSIDTGAYVGGVGTCDTPLDLDYVANREEMWVRCAEPQDKEIDPKSGHMTVVSVNSLSATSEEVRLSDHRQYGRSVFHSSLGNYGYATANDVGVIYVVDLAHRTVATNFTLPGAHSSYDATYSPFNKHLYIRSRVCCSCGFDGADVASCGRGTPTPMTITLGPSAGQTVNGTCGGGCEGSSADLLGVMEYDTSSGTFMKNHNIKEGTGFGATPEASPDGKHIVLFPNDGGQNIRVLQANGNGEASSLAFDVPVDFQNVPPAREAANDFAFVNWDRHNILALVSRADSHMALVDLSTTPPAVHKLQLSSSDEGNGGQTVEWVYGSPYIWVGNNGANEAYVVRLSDDGDITKATLERTVADAGMIHMIYVENYAARKEENMLEQVVVGLLGDISQPTTTTPPGNTAVTSSSNTDVTSSGNTATTTTTSSPGPDMELMADQIRSELAMDFDFAGDDESGPDTLAVVAIIVACISLLVNGVVILHFSHQQNVPVPTNKHSTAAGTPSNSEQADVMTLGSKQVA